MVSIIIVVVSYYIKRTGCSLGENIRHMLRIEYKGRLGTTGEVYNYYVLALLCSERTIGNYFWCPLIIQCPLSEVPL